LSARVGLTAALFIIGIGWGLSVPLTKIAVSTGYQPFGLIFWQLVIVVLLLAPINRVRGKSLPMGRPQIEIFVVVALLGTILPDAVAFMVMVHLPAGVMAIVLSIVPMITFPIALLLGIDRFNWLRIGGLICGLIGILLLVGPEASLPERAMVAFIPLALFAPICYGTEGNLVAYFGMRGMDAVQVLLGASLVGLVFALPLVLATGQWIDPLVPWGRAQWALVGSSAIHGLVYTGYVWLVGRAGSVFAAQVAYLVTGFGVIWSILLLGESYSAYIWAALAMMFAGIFLVQPRQQD
jgi:drug/metabolite transporter (DMT)-like permease